MKRKLIIVLILFLCILFTAPVLPTKNFLGWQEDVVEVLEEEEETFFLATFEPTIVVGKSILLGSCSFHAGPTLFVVVPPPKHFA